MRLYRARNVLSARRSTAVDYIEESTSFTTLDGHCRRISVNRSLELSNDMDGRTSTLTAFTARRYASAVYAVVGPPKVPFPILIGTTLTTVLHRAVCDDTTAEVCVDSAARNRYAHWQSKLEVSEGVRALDRKYACEVGRNYAKFEFTVVNDVESKESSCRLGTGSTHFDA